MTSNVYAQNTRISQYFNTLPHLFSLYEEMIDLINATDCQEIGLKITGKTLEYPIWKMLEERGIQATIQHILVENPTRTKMSTEYHPCAIISEQELEEYSQTYFWKRIGQAQAIGYYVYLDPETIRDKAKLTLDIQRPIKRLPDGFIAPPRISISLGEGWYGWENGQRWMQAKGCFWLFVDRKTSVILHLRPNLIATHQGTFGDKGMLALSLGKSSLLTLDLHANETHDIKFTVDWGANLICLELDVPGIVPSKASPGSKDNRSLAVLWEPIEITLENNPYIFVILYPHSRLCANAMFWRTNGPV